MKLRRRVDTDTFIALRIEWCKSRARANCWKEECELIQEEMRRVITYHNWRAEWWLAKVNTSADLRKDHQEGLAAYAHHQSEVRRLLAESCSHSWCYVKQWMKAGAGDAGESTSALESLGEEFQGAISSE